MSFFLCEVLSALGRVEDTLQLKEDSLVTDDFNNRRSLPSRQPKIHSLD